MSLQYGFLASILLFLTSLTFVRASTTNYALEPRTIHELNKAEFAVFIVFAVLTFGQLLLVAWPGFTKKQDSSAPALGAESGPQRRPFQFLMGLALLSFIVKYSAGACSLTSSSDTFGTVVAYVLTTELADELLYAVLFMFLTTCTMALERQHTGGIASPVRRTRNGSSIPYDAVLLILMVLATIARTFVVGLSDNALGAPRLAQFVLYQIHILIFVIAAIYFTATAISTWRRQGELALQPLESVDDKGAASVLVDTLRRMAKHISPLLCILTVYKVISDILTSISVGNPWALSLVSVIVEGLIYFILISVTICAGFISK